MKPSTYLIYSPVNDQSLVIVAFLRKYFPTSYIVGILLESNAKPVGRKYYDEIIDTVQAVQFKGIKIPTGTSATKYLLEQGDVALGLITLTQSTLRVFDKPWMLSQALEAGIPIPKTWQSLAAVGVYPLFYKQRYEQGGGARGIAFKEEDIPKEGKEFLIFQEFINSKGTYGISFLATQGETLVTYTHFEKASVPKSGGSAALIEPFQDERLVKHTVRLINHLKYSGWGLAEFKYCPHRDDYVLMEINAKFWASCELAFVNEPRFVKLLFDIDSKERYIKKIFFIHRALSRGLIFLIAHTCFCGMDAKIQGYSRFWRGFISKLFPKKVLELIKRYIR